MQPNPVSDLGVDEPPDHLQLPDKDGKPVENFQERPQTELLSDVLTPQLRRRYPDGQFIIGGNSGIYFKHTKPPLDGCRAPDFYVVIGVPPMLDGAWRRSYVLWKEMVKPTLVIEYVSKDGTEERDRTPGTGKFWIYERAISASYYVIFDGIRETLEVHRLIDNRYQELPPNEAGRFLIEPWGMELGTWGGGYREYGECCWLRLWDAETGQRLPTSEETADREQQLRLSQTERAEVAENLVDDTRRRLEEETERAEAERHRAEKEAARAERLAEKLRALGVDPEAA